MNSYKIFKSKVVSTLSDAAATKKTTMKKYYLFSERGTTERFFCGNIYEALPTDEIRYHGCPMSFQDCVNEEVCKEFDTRKEANDYSRSEDEAMEESNNYANRAMRDEEIFGMEGVDNCLNDY